MRKTVLRGGNDEYKLNEILGQKFKQVVTALEVEGFNPFLYKFATSDDKTTSSAVKPDDKDLWYHLPEFLIAAGAAFKAIEAPDVRKAEAVSEYGNIVTKALGEIKSGTIATTPLSKFNFDQLPFSYSPQGSTIKHLVPGFHLLPFKPQIYGDANVIKESYNGLYNAILYLYHYISLLDTKGLNAREVITLLRGDNLHFMPYVNNTVDTLLQSASFTAAGLSAESRPFVQEGVLNGLAGVATQIINKLNGIEESPKSAILAALTTPGKSPQDIIIQELLKTTDPKNLVRALGDLKNLLAQGNKSTNLGLDASVLKKYAIDSLFNPSYILGNVKKNIKPEELPAQDGGARKRRQNSKYMVGGATVVSLPNLYGPITPRGLRNLTTEAEQGNELENAELVYVDNVKKINGIVAALVALGGLETNALRVPLLALINYIVENNTIELNASDDSKILNLMNKALEGYQQLESRLKFLSTANWKTVIDSLYDAFISEFTLGSYQRLRPLTGTVTEKTNTLATPEIQKFYNDVVSKDIRFYEKFFNLVRFAVTADGSAPSGEVPLGAAVGLSADELKKYRLNVKKVQGRSYLSGIQRGGQYGDIVLTTLIPDFTDVVKDVWVSRANRIAHNELPGAEAIREIVRKVYTSPPGTKTITIGPVNLQIADVIRRASQGVFGVNYATVFNLALSKVALGQAPGLTQAWKESELKLSDHMLKEASRWEREGDMFVLKDEKGETIATQPEDNCAFIKDTNECLAFFEGCAIAEGDAFPEACKKILDPAFFNFDTNTAMNVLVDEIKKINPFAAFAILKQFKFGESLEEEPNHPVPGFRRYKVQSVGSWLEELLAGTDRCAKPSAIKQDPCGTLKEQLGDVANIIIAMANDPTKKPFFNYLDVLVHWVNANPQVLNKEETKGCIGVGDQKYPKADKSFNMYSYRNPYKPAEIRLRDMSCGLERLKGSIMNELAGAQGATIISSVASVPYGIEMPFARPGFTNPLPLGNYFPAAMYGGGQYDTLFELQNINDQFGYKLFYEIYVYFVNTMASMRCNKKIGLSQDSKGKIQSKLESFKQAEEELRKDIARLLEQNKLYQASRGHVDVSQITDENQLKAVLAKHSNLLKRSATYNKKAINMIDLFQTISKAILGKMEGNCQDGTTKKYERPLTANYHN